ncbi:MAG: GNAT family N-acetyltransferase [Clostridiales bacterium]|nr:GNAT family N-acetyltransferase [Clostridiales bacterium]
MEITAKRFHELNVDELFEIYKLRSDVFVCEQKCTEPDVDDMDKVAIHVMLRENDGLKGYLRIITKENGTVLFGRVVSKERRRGIGTKIMGFATDYSKKELGADKIAIDAQTQAIAFYESVGFRVISEEFMEAGIPHKKMLRNI